MALRSSNTRPLRTPSVARKDHARTKKQPVVAARRRAAPPTVARKRSPQLRSKTSGWRVPAWGSLLLIFAVCCLGIVGWVYLALIPSWFSPDTARFVAVVPETVDPQEKKLYLVWLGETATSSHIWSIPSELQVALPESYGQYRAGSMYPLLKLDQRSEHFVDAVLSRGLGAVVTGRVVLPAATAANDLDERLWQQAVMQLRSLRMNQLKTTLQIWQLAHNSTQCTEKQTVAELQESVRAVRKGTYPQECSLAILNASDTAGEATALARVAELNGITTVRVDTYPEKVAESSLYADPDSRELCSGVINTLQQVFTQSEGIVVTEDKTMVDRYYTPLVIVVGERF